MSIEVVTFSKPLSECREGYEYEILSADRFKKHGFEVQCSNSFSQDQQSIIHTLRCAFSNSAVVVAFNAVDSDFFQTILTSMNIVLHKPTQHTYASSDNESIAIYEQGSCWLIVLSIQIENLEDRFEEIMMPSIKKAVLAQQNTLKKNFHFYLKDHFYQTSDIETILLKYPLLQVFYYKKEDIFHLTIYAQESSSFKSVVQHLNAVMHKVCLPYPTLEESIQHRLIAHKETLALAESCTGGAIAASLTKIAGASAYFVGSLVTYSNQMKTDLLGVSAQTLAVHGPVSYETAQEMLQGLMLKTGADRTLVVTGIAGPDGGTVSQPVGTIWYALGHKLTVLQIAKLSLTGDRTTIIKNAVSRLLAIVWESLNI